MSQNDVFIGTGSCDEVCASDTYGKGELSQACRECREKYNKCPLSYQLYVTSCDISPGKRRLMIRVG